MVGVEGVGRGVVEFELIYLDCSGLRHREQVVGTIGGNSDDSVLSISYH